jgi:hypothetical protein
MRKCPINKITPAITTEDVGQAIIRTLTFDGLEFIDDSDENNLRVVTEDGVFTIRIFRSGGD